MDHDAFNQTLQFHYRSPSPEAAAEALRWWVTASHPMQVDFHVNPCNLVLYAFICLTELHPSLIRTSEQLYEEANSWGQGFLARLLAHVGDTASETWAGNKGESDSNRDLQLLRSGKRQDRIRTLPIVHPVQLDLLWTEFCITGDEKPVHDIAWCFTEPSVVRSRLNEWLAKRGILSWIFRRRRADQIDRMKESLGIVCQGTEVQNREDLDVLCLQEEGFGNITYHSYSEAARVLPIRVPFRERSRMMIKMLAKWSFFSNALQHERVREICLQGLHEPPPITNATTSQIHGYLTFLDIGVNLYLAQNDSPQAFRLAQQFVQADPYSCRARRLRDRLATEELISLPETFDDAIPVHGSHANELLQKCTESTQQAQSYFSLCRLHNSAPGQKSEATWRFSYEKPGNFEVQQETRSEADQTGPKYDFWITLNGITLNQFQLMSQSPDAGDKNEPPVNRQLLLVDNILASIPQLKIEESAEAADSQYLVVRGTLSEPPEYVRDFFHQTDAERCRLSIWIFNEHQETPLLAKFCLQFGSMTIEQAFCGYNIAHVSLGAHA